MSYEPITLFIPVIYAGLQYDALTRMQGGWKVAALMPAILFMFAFVFQVMLGVVAPQLAIWVPLVAMCVAVAYLAALNGRFDRALQAEDRQAAAGAPENVVFLNDFR